MFDLGAMYRDYMYNPEEEERKRRGLLGESITSQMSGTSMEFDQNGNPINIKQQQPTIYDRQGTGFLGSDRGPMAQANLINEAQGLGYSPQQAVALLQPIQQAQQQPLKPTGLMQNLSAAGVDFNTKEGQQTLLDAVMKPQTQITQNLGGSVGSIWKPEQVKAAGFAPGTVVTQDRYGKPQVLNKEKYTQPQILSGTYAARMDDATNSIKKIMETGFDPAGIMQNIDFFGSPEIVANYMRTPEGQQYRQAQENWISANLRKESGAAIPEEEMDREIKKWFPYPGDKVQNIAQKSQARKTAERGMRKAAGGSYQELIDQAERDRLEELRAKHGTK